jgi:hypothetical protein
VRGERQAQHHDGAEYPFLGHLECDAHSSTSPARMLCGSSG